MNRNFSIIVLFPVLIALSILSVSYFPEKDNSREVASFFDWFGLKGAVKKAATVEVEALDAKVIVDNNKAFESKVRLIRSAKESIRMSYFIYSNDQSSSVITQELIAAAKRGVKVKLIVDLHANYKRLDLFKMIERQGAPNIDIRLYNRPTKNLVRSALYLTTPCPGLSFEDKACYKYKNKIIESILKKSTHDKSSKNRNKISNAHTKYSQMFLSGIYAKDPKLVAKAVIEGQQLDLDHLMSSGDTSDAEKAALKELATIYYKSKFGTPLESVMSKIKLIAAFVIYRDQIMPVVNTLSALLPTKTRNDKDHMKDIEYLTDFTHHKILLIDNTQIQLGGRNIENSYHMDQNDLTQKYTFMDTDVQLDLQDGGSDMERAFDEIFEYTRMLARIDEVDQFAPVDYVMNTKAMNKASKKCKPYLEAKKSAKYIECFDWMFGRSKDSDEKRIEGQREKMVAGAYQFKRTYRKPKLDSDFNAVLKRNFEIEFGDESVVAYLENLHLNRREMAGAHQGQAQIKLPLAPEDRTKTYGARNSYDRKHGKNINYVLKKSFKEVCKQAHKGGSKKVIFHNAYFLPPAGVYAELARMVDGTYNCAGVTIQLLTNSVETTDLSIINTFSKYGLTTFLKFANERENKRSAKVEYYEYKPLSIDPKKNISLHSKVFILGDHAFIGSLNIDPRSYAMDTNNGFFFYNVRPFVDDYVSNFDRIIGNSRFVANMTEDMMNSSIDEYAKNDLSTVKQILKSHAGEYVSQIPKDWRDKGEDFIVKQLKDIAAKTRLVIEKKRSKDQDKLDRLLQLL